MNAIDWLRGKAKQKTAGGGIVHGEHGPELVNLPTGYLVPTSLPEPSEPQPVAVIAIDGTVTEQQAQQIRDSIQVLGRSRAQRSSESLGCPCAVIYSVCYCGGQS